MNPSDQGWAVRRGDALDPTGILAELIEVLTPPSVDVALDAIVDLARRRIPGADDVSITVLDDGPSTVASTGSLAVELDAQLHASGSGPCLHAAEYGRPVTIGEMAADIRWPPFSEAAVAAGIGSSLSAPLQTQLHLKGALNVYAARPRAFDEPVRELVESFAAHAARGLAKAHSYARAAHEAENLREAMRTRAVIEQAKGMLMAIRQCTADEAFNVLVNLSQNQHRKLRDVAAAIVSRASTHPVRLDEDV